jgi:hypothetical protein
MRYRIGFLAFWMAAGVEAHASSFVSVGLPARAETPSIVYLGSATASRAPLVLTDAPALSYPYPGGMEPAPGASTAPVVISPSIVALGTPAPDPVPPVAQEAVAAIPAPAETTSARQPRRDMTVIRGGLVGDAVAAPPPPASPPRAAAAPAPTFTPGAPGGTAALPEPEDLPAPPQPSAPPPLLRGPE